MTYRAPRNHPLPSAQSEARVDLEKALFDAEDQLRAVSAQLDRREQEHSKKDQRAAARVQALEGEFKGLREQTELERVGRRDKEMALQSQAGQMAQLRETLTEASPIPY